MTEPGERILRIVFLGTADFAVPVLRSLAAGLDPIVGVFTPPDRPAGRGRRLRPPPVKTTAEELGLLVFQPERVSAGAGFERLQALSPDLLFVAAFGQILAPQVLALPRIGALNLHASLLPRYRGAAPIQRALMAGEQITGVTVQWMAPEMDAGDILLQRQLEIGEDEDFGRLHDRLADLGAQAACESISLIHRGDAPRLPQDRSQATFAPPITPADLTLDWTRPALTLARQVRALAPRPGARTTRRGELLKVLHAHPGKNHAHGGGIPGQIMEFSSDGFRVTTGEGVLVVTGVQPAGRTSMAAADYLKGYRLEQGERLGL